MTIGDRVNRNFTLGRVYATPGVLEVLSQEGEAPAEFLDRHARGDWGCVTSDDARRNDQAVADGSRILSAYETKRGIRVWIITEAADECGVRTATTILLPSEY